MLRRVLERLERGNAQCLLGAFSNTLSRRIALDTAEIVAMFWSVS